MNEIIPTFIVGVCVNDENYDECAPYATVCIDEKLYRWIKKAQSAVKKLKAYSMETFESPYAWNQPVDGCSKELADLTLSDLEDYDGMRTDCDILKVTDKRIFYDCNIKYVDKSAMTDGIEIKDIDKCFKVLSMPLDEMPTLIHHDNFWIRNIAQERLKNGA